MLRISSTSPDPVFEQLLPQYFDGQADAESLRLLPRTPAAPSVVR